MDILPYAKTHNVQLPNIPQRLKLAFYQPFPPQPFDTPPECEYTYYPLQTQYQLTKLIEILTQPRLSRYHK